jgi:signal peptidase I
MGDNRGNSADSRYHRDDAHGGFVPLTNVVGVAKAVFSWTSLSRWGSLGGGDEAFSQVPERDTAPPAKTPTPSRSTTGPTQRPTDLDDPDDPDEDGASSDGPSTETGEVGNDSGRTGAGRIGSDPGAEGEDTEPRTSGDRRSDTGFAGAGSLSSTGRPGGPGTDIGMKQ